VKGVQSYFDPAPFWALNLRKTLFYFSMEAYIVKLAKGIQIFGQLLHSFENIPDK
jgi:hypothetical protein